MRASDKGSISDRQGGKWAVVQIDQEAVRTGYRQVLAQTQVPTILMAQLAQWGCPEDSPWPNSRFLHCFL